MFKNMKSKFNQILLYINVHQKRIYYQFKSDHLSACPLTAHALLHILNDIQNNGPPCMNWTFMEADRKSTRLNSSHTVISYAVFCLKKKKYLTRTSNSAKI